LLGSGVMAAAGEEPEVWVRYADGVSAVSTAGCRHVDHLREAIKKKFSRKLGEYDASDLIVSYVGDDGREVVLDPRRPIGDVPDDKELTVVVAAAAAVPAAPAAAAAPARECAPLAARRGRRRLCVCVCARLPHTRPTARRVAVRVAVRSWRRRCGGRRWWRCVAVRAPVLVWRSACLLLTACSRARVCLVAQVARAVLAAVVVENVSSAADV
jgi:hypothetical protein